MNKVLFTVGLSNGETIAEETGNFSTIEGELSPWQRLLSYIKEKDVTITSLSLYTKDGKRWLLPSAGKNPKFREMEFTIKPVSYRFFRKMGADINRSTGNTIGEQIYAVAEATLENGQKLQVWVSEANEASWSLVF